MIESKCEEAPKRTEIDQINSALYEIQESLAGSVERVNQCNIRLNGTVPEPSQECESSCSAGILPDIKNKLSKLDELNKEMSQRLNMLEDLI